MAAGPPTHGLRPQESRPKGLLVVYARVAELSVVWATLWMLPSLTERLGSVSARPATM
jgi:hypothetical protein